MPNIHGIDCSVWIDGIKAEEYDLKQTGNKLTCYVISELGRSFSFRTVNSSPTIVAAQYSADGAASGGQAIQPLGVASPAIFEGPCDRNGYLHRFQFADIKTTDADTEVTASEESVKGAGSLSVFVRRVASLAALPRNSGGVDVRAPPVFHEQSKKATLKHQASTAPPVPSATANTPSVTPVYFDHADWIVFEFLYRSRAFLEAKDIVPRIPGAPTIAPEPVAAPPAAKPAKRPSESKPPEAKRVKTEDAPAAKPARELTPVFIDLTDD